MLVVGMIRVVEIDIERIIEDGLCLLKRDAVHLKVGPSLSFIPLKIHGGSIAPPAGRMASLEEEA